MERLLALKTPPVVGQTYMVPVTKLNGFAWITVPVIGHAHNDRELGMQDVDHIHIDRRFITDAELLLIGFSDSTLANRNGTVALNISLLNGEPLKVWEEPRECLVDDFPQWRSFKAGRAGLLAKEVRQLREEKGVTHLNMDCKVCPHKGTRLDNCKPRDGVLLCPAHGMEFDAETGEILQF